MMAMTSTGIELPRRRSVEHTSVRFLCPSCEHPLDYIGTDADTATDATQDRNDYFTCPVGCGTFQHERSSHRFRQLE